MRTIWISEVRQRLLGALVANVVPGLPAFRLGLEKSNLPLTATAKIAYPRGYGFEAHDATSCRAASSRPVESRLLPLETSDKELAMTGTQLHIIDAPLKFELDQNTATVRVTATGTYETLGQAFQMKQVLVLTQASGKALLEALPRLQTLLETQAKGPTRPTYLQ